MTLNEERAARYAEDNQLDKNHEMTEFIAFAIEKQLKKLMKTSGLGFVALTGVGEGCCTIRMTHPKQTTGMGIGELFVQYHEGGFLIESGAFTVETTAADAFIKNHPTVTDKTPDDYYSKTYECTMNPALLKELKTFYPTAVAMVNEILAIHEARVKKDEGSVWKSPIVITPAMRAAGWVTITHDKQVGMREMSGNTGGIARIVNPNLTAVITRAYPGNRTDRRDGFHLTAVYTAIYKTARNERHAAGLYMAASDNNIEPLLAFNDFNESM